MQTYGLKETRDIGMYLGGPSIGQHPKAKHYQYLIEKTGTKPTSWKGKQLSFVRRVTIAKTVLDAIPTYTMMSNRVPTTFLKEIQNIQRNFIWGHNEDERRMHTINRKEITKPKMIGELGLRNLKDMNVVCVTKLNWKIKTEEESLWCKVMCGKCDRKSTNDNEVYAHVYHLI